jgi:hypothetical protein
MDVEVNRAAAPETPASTMSAYVVEHATALMTIGGIESISAQKYSCGLGSRLHVSMAPFADAPEDIVAQGVVMKDAIAQVLSVANIVSVTIKPNEDEMKDVRTMWEKSSGEAKAGNQGSSQAVTEESS